MSSPQYPTARPPGWEHIPIYPTGFIAIRIVQLVLAVIVLGLSAFSIFYLAWDANTFILAVAVMTLVSSVYHLIAHYGAPAMHNYWAILSLDIFFIVMWLCSCALQASRVGLMFATISPFTSYGSYNPRTGRYTSTVGLNDTELAWLATQAAAAALGGVEFLLYLIALVIHSIRLHRHRAAGLHCMPGVPPTPPAPVSGIGPYGPGTGKTAPAYQHYPPQQFPQHSVPVQAYQQQQFYPPQQQQGYPPLGQGHVVPVPGQQQQQPPQGYYAPAPPSTAPATDPAPAPAPAPTAAAPLPEPSQSPAPTTDSGYPGQGQQGQGQQQPQV